nr:MAG TPA: hypothetical protein [Caudoviricetes sp.]
MRSPARRAASQLSIQVLYPRLTPYLCGYCLTLELLILL